MPSHRSTTQPQTGRRRAMPYIPLLHALATRDLGTTKHPRYLLTGADFPSEPHSRCIYSVPDPSQPTSSPVRYKLLYTADDRKYTVVVLWIIPGILSALTSLFYLDPICRPGVPKVLAGSWGLVAAGWLAGRPWSPERKKETWWKWLRLTLPEQLKPEDFKELTGKDKNRALSCVSCTLQDEMWRWEKAMYGPIKKRQEEEESNYDEYVTEREHEMNMRVKSMLAMVDRDLFNETVTKVELGNPDGYMCPATRYFRIATELLACTF